MELAARGCTLVYGGGRVGLMGVLADAALAAGGRVIGVISRGARAARGGAFGTQRAPDHCDHARAQGAHGRALGLGGRAARRARHAGGAVRDPRPGTSSASARSRSGSSTRRATSTGCSRTSTTPSPSASCTPPTAPCWSAATPRPGCSMRSRPWRPRWSSRSGSIARERRAGGLGLLLRLVHESPHVLAEVGLAPAEWHAARLAGFDIRIAPARESGARARPAGVRGACDRDSPRARAALRPRARRPRRRSISPSRSSPSLSTGCSDPRCATSPTPCASSPRRAPTSNRIVAPARELGFPEEYVARLGALPRREPEEYAWRRTSSRRGYDVRFEWGELGLRALAEQARVS